MEECTHNGQQAKQTNRHLFGKYTEKSVCISTYQQKAISMSVRDLSFQHWPNQIDKVKQLYNQIMVRHGVMLVGPTGGGKTSVRHILQKALVLLPMIHPHNSGGAAGAGDGGETDREAAGARRQTVFIVSISCQWFSLAVQENRSNFMY